MTARVITIGREYGSGGRTIGELIAKKLGVAFYDKILIDIAAKKGGFAIDYIKNTEEKVTPNFLFNLAANGYYTHSMLVHDGLPASDKLFVLQTKMIQEIASNEPCVIVGRCADYILRARADCMNVFIYAPLADRIRRAVTEYGLGEDNAENAVKRNDKIRAKHYQYYTGQRWGDTDSYHMMLNSSAFGCKKTAELIAAAAEEFN